MDLLLVGICTAFNFAIIIHKFRKSRFFDGCLDLTIMAIICALFSGTFGALVVGMVASMIISFYLLFSRIELPKF